MAKKVKRDRTQLLALPLDGGSARVITEVEGAIREAGADHMGRIHFTMMKDERDDAMVVPVSGGTAEKEAPAPWSTVLPLADGWRLGVQRRGVINIELHFLRPGAALGDPPARMIKSVRYQLIEDGRAVAYMTGTQIRRYTPSTDKDELILDRGVVLPYALSPDGKMLYVVDASNSASPQLITNFGDRPRVR
jgi:hypothetical protein